MSMTGQPAVWNVVLVIRPSTALSVGSVKMSGFVRAASVLRGIHLTPHKHLTGT